ncbi:MAG: MFS transporter, partial [Veillonella sp.]|nr:MFS transporter [Veillonella sp.]
MSLFNLFGPTQSGASRQRWVTLAWLFLLTAINYLDRTNMAVAAPALREELNLDPFMLGLLFSAFSWSYGLLQIPGGWFLDRIGARNAYTASLFFWSLFTVFMGWGYSFVVLFAIRLLVGMAEAPAFPSNSR